MKKVLTNKWTYVALCMFLGVVFLFWGLDKDDSTLAHRTKGATFLIVLGIASFVGSFIALLSGTKK